VTLKQSSGGGTAEAAGPPASAFVPPRSCDRRVVAASSGSCPPSRRCSTARRNVRAGRSCRSCDKRTSYSQVPPGPAPPQPPRARATSLPGASCSSSVGRYRAATARDDLQSATVFLCRRRGEPSVCWWHDQLLLALPRPRARSSRTGGRAPVHHQVREGSREPLETYHDLVKTKIRRRGYAPEREVGSRGSAQCDPRSTK
jgi:hypothetical protein